MKLEFRCLFSFVLFFALMVSYTYPDEIKKHFESDSIFNSNSIYIELFGQGIGLSLNADYRFQPNLTFRAGLSYLIFGYGIPLSLNYLTGKNSSHHLELGLGIT